jgi:hypothetical protein
MIGKMWGRNAFHCSKGAFVQAHKVMSFAWLPRATRRANVNLCSIRPTQSFHLADRRSAGFSRQFFIANFHEQT